jgi:cellulose synthase/poly-beta-1,6-N-acetylglucosamine synthase-like glycosyltransferase
MLLASIYQQTYPLEKMEVIIADGLSTDNTHQEIQSFIEAHPDLSVSVVDNPQRIIPAGLNLAISASEGDIILRLDAHSIPAKDYVQRCVEALESGLGENVGGLWEIQPGGEAWQARAIANAAAHPLGVGDARYRVGGEAQEVDTVPFGAFKRSLIDQVGFFDETLLTNEDYEFNNRIRQSGGVIWFDPEIRSQYIARDTIPSLARQYWRYGFWKSRMLRRFPGTFRWRQLPPVFVISFPLLAVLSIWFWWARWLLILEIVIYTGALLFAGIQQAVKLRDFALVLGVPLAIATMHFSWGTGFIWSMIRN